MKALWNNLFVPALVVALGFSAVSVHADDKSNNGGSRGGSQSASHQTSSPAKSSTSKSSSSPATTSSSAKSGMATSKNNGPASGTSTKATGGMKKDSTSTGNSKPTTPKKDSTSSTKGTSTGTTSKKDTKPTTSTSKKESPWGGDKKGSDWGGYGGTGSVDSKGMPTDNKKTNPPKDTKGSTTSNKKDSPWGEQTSKGSKTTKPGKDSYPASTSKMDPCPKEMPKTKTGGHWTQDQCAPKWNTCATYNKWTNCPNEWHVSFRNSYCLPTNYCFWQKKYYDTRCGCYTYYDSYSSGWYYYEPVVKCYIPVSYCEQYEVERTESLEQVDVCEVEVPVCETVQNYRVLPVKPACQPFTYGRYGR
ncbi:MAG: hypothetical protein QM703_07245 [Gemmatales bacterium]